jgi:hypothetical protein
LGKILHRPAWVRVPRPALRLLFGQAAQALVSSQRAEPRRVLAFGFVHRFPSVEQALADLLGSASDVQIGSPREWPESDYLRRRGARYQLRQTTAIDAPVETVFDFFSRAENLGAMTPPAMGFSILNESPIDMRAGATIDYWVRLGPFRLRWRTVIERWHPNSLFVDSQHRGPYRSWWHEHRFTRAGRGTLMEDVVYYSPPLGPLGRIAHRAFVAPSLRRIFGFRARAIGLRFGRATESPLPRG